MLSLAYPQSVPIILYYIALYCRSQEHDLEEELTLKLNEMQEAAAALDVLLTTAVEKPSPLAKKAVPNAPSGTTAADQPRGARVRAAPERFTDPSPAKRPCRRAAQPEEEEAAAPAAPEAAPPEAAPAAEKPARGRPPGAPNKDESAKRLAGLASKDQEISNLKTEAKDLKAEAKELRGRLEEEVRKNGKLTEEVKQINSTLDLKIENAVNKAKMQSLFYFIQKKFNTPYTPTSGTSSSCETPDTSMPMDRNMAAFFMGSGGFD